MARHSYAIEPGGLSGVHHDRIVELADRGLKATQIARKLKKHPSTVHWFMYRNGLAAPTYRDAKPYFRSGKLVTPFDAAEDAFIEALCMEGLRPKEIAERDNTKFGRGRVGHTVRCRLIMIAAREDE